MAQRALLVGVNRYRDPDIPALYGCVNDIGAVRNMLLTHCGFQVPDVRLLADARATLVNIRSRLRWLVADARAGDRLIFYFAGRGSEIRERPSGQLADVREEILCPHDMNWDDGYIVERELRQVFGQLTEGVLLEVVLDTCHAGTDPQDVTQQSRYLTAPADIAARIEDVPLRGLFPYEQEVAWCRWSQLVWRASGFRESAVDAYIHGRWHGAFTHYFCRVLDDSRGATSRAALLRHVQEALEEDGCQQVPQLQILSAGRTDSLAATPFASAAGVAAVT
jgi:hypothetical protein